MVAHTIGNALRNTTGSVHHIILVLLALDPLLALLDHLLALHDPRALGITLHLGVALHFAIEFNHVLLELDAIELRVAPIEVGLSIVVNHDRGVDVVPLTVLVKWLAQRVAIRTFHLVGYSHADGHAVRDVGVNWYIKIELTVALDALRSPGAVVGPLEVTLRQGATVVGPVDHVGGREEAPLVHPEEVGLLLVMAGEDIETVATHHRSRVGRKTGLSNGVLRTEGERQHSAHECRK